MSFCELNVLLNLALDDLLDDGWEVLHFQLVYLVGNVVGGVGGVETDGELGDVLALVKLGVDEVDGDARTGLVGGVDGFVYMVAPHALAAELGQEGGVDVDDATGVSLHQIGGHFGQEACQDDVVAAVDGAEHEVGVVVELLAGDDGGGHAQSLGAHEGVGIRAAADDDGDFHVGVVLEVLDDVLAVGSAAGHEDGEADGGHEVCVHRALVEKRGWGNRPPPCCKGTKKSATWALFG